MPPQDGIKPPRREGMEHVAQQGETLASIAQRYGVTVKSLMNNNPGLTPQHLRVGRRLSINDVFLRQPLDLPGIAPVLRGEIARWRFSPCRIFRIESASSSCSD